MRSIRYVVALGATLIASFGGVAGASAHQFRYGGDGSVESRATTEQVLTGPLGVDVKCAIAAGVGVTKLNGETLEMAVSYGECEGGEPVNPVHYVFSPNGEVEVAQEVAINKTVLGTCKVEKQTRPGITYKTVGTRAAKDREIEVAANVKNIKTTCGEATYTGTNMWRGSGFELWYE